ncbi:MAG: hypothetical protein ACOCUT_02930 [bacterium]
MNIKFFYFLIFLLFSCAHTRNLSSLQGKNTYEFSDISGSYILEKQTIVKKNEIVTKTEIKSPASQLPLEKTIGVTQIGTVKDKKIPRPHISQHTLWLEGKKYFSQLKVIPNERSLEVVTKSPEPRWNGKQNYKFPSGKDVYCFFTQVVKCLRTVNYFNASTATEAGGKIDFYLIWDGFPYMGEQYDIVADDPFERVTMYYEGREKNMYRYILKIGNQVILYQLDNDFEVDKMFWVSQGISMIRKGEG